MWLDNASDIDILFYKPYASIISDIAKNKEYNPLTIGVFGLWGSGKSTLLGLVENELSKNDGKIVCVQINAWMFEGYEDAKTALMESLLKELEEKKPFEGTKERIRKLLKRLDFFRIGTSLLSAGAPVIASAVTGNPLPLLLNLTGNSEKIGETIKSVAQSLQDYKDNNVKESTVDNVRQFKQDFELMLEEANIDNVVVLIDDLDRCLPDRIIETLEAIKLFLSAKRTTFIIAADEHVIQYAIKKKYPHVDNSDVELSTEYIEKIVQLPIYIPELSSKDIENYLLLLVTQKYLSSDDFGQLIKVIYDRHYTVRETCITLQDVTDLIKELRLSYVSTESGFMEDASIIDNIRDIVASTLKGNPRQAKRFLNTFVTKKTLAKTYYGDELDMRIMVKMLVLQKLDPDLFVQLNEWNRNFTLRDDEFKEMYDAIESNENVDIRYSKWAVPAIKKWLACEPKDLYSIRLDKYFYLTREHLKKSDVDIQGFSQDARKVLDKLGNVVQGTVSSAIEQMKKLEPSDLQDVFSTLLPRIERSQLEIFVTKELFMEFSSYQKDIAEAISKISQKVTLPDSVYLIAMLKANSALITPVLERLKGSGILDAKLYAHIYKDKAVK